MLAQLMGQEQTQLHMEASCIIPVLRDGDIFQTTPLPLISNKQGVVQPGEGGRSKQECSFCSSISTKALPFLGSISSVPLLHDSFSGSPHGLERSQDIGDSS